MTSKDILCKTMNVVDNNLLYSWLAIIDFTYYHYKRWWVYEIIILSDLAFPSFVHIYKHYIVHVKKCSFYWSLFKNGSSDDYDV